MNQKFLTVLSYEYANLFRNKFFRGFTIVIIALIGIVLSWPSIAGGSEQQPGSEQASKSVIVLDQTGALEQSALNDDGYGYRLSLFTGSEQEARAAVENGSAHAALIINSPAQYTLIQQRLDIFDDAGLAGAIGEKFGDYFKRLALKEYGLTEQQMLAIMQPPSVEFVEIAQEAGKSMTQTYLYTYVMIMLLYMSIMLYGQMVAMSVGNEKSSRTIEILITSAKPTELMFGKVIGTGLVGLTQIGVWLLSAVLFYNANAAAWQGNAMVSAFFGMPLSTFILVFVFYILGFFMYAFLFGALGSLASRTEEINALVTPVTLLSVASFMIAIFGMMDPDGAVLKAFSFVPFFSPVCMFVRIIMIEVPLFEIIISMVIMVLTIYSVGWLSAQIYRIGVLMYGKPPKLSVLTKTILAQRRQKRSH